MAFSDDACKRLLWRIASLSPLARRRLETEDYRHHVLVDEDGPEEQLFDIFQSLLHDLETIGVTFAEPITDIFCSELAFNHFLDLMDYFFPSELYITLRDDKTLQHGLYCLTDGSVVSSNLLLEYLLYLERYKPVLSPAIEYYKDKLVGSGTFADYLLGLQSHLNDQCVQSILDDDRVLLLDNYITKVKSLVESLTEAEIIKDKIPYEKIIRQMEHSYCDPDYANRTATWLSMQYNKLPESMREFYLRLTKTILVQNPLSDFYYEIRSNLAQDALREHVIAVCILGIATRKYGASRWIKKYPQFKELITDIYERSK